MESMDKDENCSFSWNEHIKIAAGTCNIARTFHHLIINIAIDNMKIKTNLNNSIRQQLVY